MESKQLLIMFVIAFVVSFGFTMTYDLAMVKAGEPSLGPENISSEKNLVSVSSINATRRPDLISDVTNVFGECVGNSCSLFVSFKVKNIGIANAGPSIVLLSRNGASEFTFFNTTSLAPGQSQFYVKNYTNLSRGNYSVLTNADYFYNVVEANEDNNVEEVTYGLF